MTEMLVSETTDERRADDATEKGVAKWVLAQLGQPADLLKVEVKKVWGANFRVNVYVAEETAKALPRVSIPDSFFVSVQDDQFVSSPAIVRKYSVGAQMGA